MEDQPIHVKGVYKKGERLHISSSSVGMESARRYTSESRKTTGFTTFMSNSKTLREGNGGLKNLLQGGMQKEESMKEEDLKNPEALVQDHFSQMRAVSKNQISEIDKAFEDLRENCIRYLMNMIFGIKKANETETSMESNVQNGTAAGSTESGNVSFTQESYYKETENTSFSTTGKVVTADGKEISFQVHLEMSRSFEQYTKTEQRFSIPVLCDPLVINLKSAPAGTLDQTFLFDIDADGKKDNISMLAEGSGFLAFDRNQDGVINDGSELFGTQNGDGFADLAQYDTDKDGWIDEDDVIFDKLKIWAKGADGKDILYTLKEAGVGAICLQKAETDFSLKDQNNRTNAAIRSTGIFLYENGMAGTVQHVDMAKR